MNVELLEVSSAQRLVLERLMQLYAYDFSELIDSEIGEDGSFATGKSLAGCWVQPWRHVYFVRVGGHLAGFAIVDQRSHLTGDPEVSDMVEFFILRKHRRQGVGSVAALRAFAQFPGRWEVRQRTGNSAATAFWRKVIGAHAAGRFEERLWADERWSGPVQSFVSASVRVP